ncbi:MAG: SDR family NAD(P)-dependent oxidoreductase [Magnetococcales bacterium]|nr:SDR family NAD(P)-dependent oxidoreductase [Magnetococcales bacterium]
MEWKDERILITGATSGLGEQLALKSAELGATLVLVARNLDELQRVKTSVQDRGGVAHVFRFDLHQYEQIPELYQQIKATLGDAPTVLINNAGYNAAGFIINTPAKVYEDNYRTNVFAPIAMMQSVLPDMLYQKKGYLVNIMSAAMHHAFPGISSYCSSKVALGSIHESLQIELASTSVKTLYVNPGSFRSRYFQNTRVDGRFKNYRYQSKAEHLRKDPRIVAEAIFKAMSDGQNHMDLSSYMDRIGHHLNYWAPRVLDWLLVRRNTEILKDRPYV